MGYGAESSFIGIVAAVVGIVLILTVVLRMWKKVPQDKAGVVTGMKKRVITGGGGLVIPVFERIDYISLGNTTQRGNKKQSFKSGCSNQRYYNSSYQGKK